MKDKILNYILLISAILIIGTYLINPILVIFPAFICFITGIYKIVLQIKEIKLANKELYKLKKKTEEYNNQRLLFSLIPSNWKYDIFQLQIFAYQEKNIWKEINKTNELFKNSKNPLKIKQYAMKLNELFDKNILLLKEGPKF